MGHPRRVKARSGPQHTERGGGGPFGGGGSTSVGGSVPHGEALGPAWLAMTTNPPVTMRSEEDEAAADGGAEAVVSAAVGATSRATPPSSASKVPMSGGASGARRKVLGRRMPAWQHACACEGHSPPAASCVGDRARVDRTPGKCGTPERYQLPTS